MMGMDEEWRVVAGFDMYEVSSLGRVRTWQVKGPKSGRSRLPEPRVFSATPNSRGYLHVGIRSGGRRIYKRVHRMVLEAFVGPCPDGMEACHNNGDRLDNRLVNLRWDTHEENSADRNRHGTQPVGSRSVNAKLDESAAEEILSRMGRDSASVVAREFGVSCKSITNIWEGRTWKHVKESRSWGC